jgi:hypothetical protein
MMTGGLCKDSLFCGSKTGRIPPIGSVWTWLPGFAMIDDGLGFSLVPWSASLEQHLGRHVSRIARIRRIERSFGRARGRSI